MRTSNNEPFSTPAADRAVAAMRFGQDRAAAFINEGFGNAIEYFESLGKAQRPYDVAIANLELATKTVNTMAKGAQTAIDLTAKLAQPAPALA